MFAEDEEPAESSSSEMSADPMARSGSSTASRLSSTASGGVSSELVANYNMEIVNKALALLKVTPVTKKQLEQKDFPREKLNEVRDTLKKKLNLEKNCDTPESEIILQQMKQAFPEANKQEKYQILTSMPSAWGVRKLQQEFGVSNRMARNAKKIQADKGILSAPGKKKAGNKLPADSLKVVEAFYNLDEVSRAMPGKKDCVTVKVDGVRKKVQKRLILCTLREAFFHFQEKNPSVKIGLAKFVELRPKHVVLPGSTGTHTVCTCVYHQNPKLMLAGSHISTEMEFKSLVHPDFNSEVKVQHLLAQLVCNPPLVSCWLGKCKVCENFSCKLKEKILLVFEELDIDDVAYKTWVSTDRTELLNITEDVVDFVDVLLDKLEALKVHDFVYRQQASYFSDLKENLAEDSCIAVGDFSENFTFLIQDAVQGNHWSKDQATLHPFVCYAKIGGVLKTIPVLIISDHLTHDTVAVFAFQKRLHTLLNTLLGTRRKQIYFSDGCGKQYKNCKNFLNVAYHKDDFGIPAVWNFFATAHGKGCWDGLAGSVKRQAAHESLRRPVHDQILTPEQLFDFAKSHFPGMHVEFVSSEEILKIESDVLADRFKAAKTINGTLTFHQFQSIEGSKTHLMVKEFSRSDISKKKKVTKKSK